MQGGRVPPLIFCGECMDYPQDASVGLVDGKFIDENEVTAQVGSLIPSTWANALTDEVLAVQSDAGLEADESNHAQLLAAIKLIVARMGQASYSSPVGTARNARMSVTAAAKTAPFTADEIILSAALGGQTYRLAAFNKTVDLTVVGVGGMDVGAAPASGFVAVYAIYNPTTGASALLAMNATAAKAPEVYGGGYMPAGYVASALVSVWPTNASSQFVAGYQEDRHFRYMTQVSVLTTATNSANTALSIAGAVPKNAKSIYGNAGFYGTASAVGAAMQIQVYPFSGASWNSVAYYVAQSATLFQISGTFWDLALPTSQTMYYTTTSSNVSSITFSITIYSYRF